MGITNKVLSALDRLGDRWVDERRGLTPQKVFGAALDEWLTAETAAGIRVDTATAFKLPVFKRCVDLLVDDISPLPADVYRRAGTGRVPVEMPAWMSLPTGDPNYTWQQHVADAVWSYATDRNVFIRCIPDRARAEAIYVVDPENVDVRTARGETTYRLLSEQVTLTSREIVHIRGGKSPGRSRAVSSVELLKETIALGLAAEEYGARFFSNGSIMTGIVEAPAGAVVDVDAIKKAMERNHKGLQRSHALGVLSGGATFRSLTIDAEKAQLLELKDQVVEDIARGHGIPPYMVGSTKPGAVAYASTSNARVDYVVHAVVPIVDRLERAYSDLVPGSDTFVKFNLNALLRGDQAARFTAYSVGLQNRFLTVDEVRAFEDWQPFGGTDGGLMYTPQNSAPASGHVDSTPDPEDDMRNLTVNVDQTDVADAVREMRLAAEEATRRLPATLANFPPMTLEQVEAVRSHLQRREAVLAIVREAA